MFRIAAFGIAGLALATAPSSRAGDDLPPRAVDLPPPIEAAKLPPPREAPPRRPLVTSTPRPDDGPVPVPVVRRGIPVRTGSAPPAIAPALDADMPALDAPLDMPAPAPGRVVGTARDAGADPRKPLLLESTPEVGVMGDEPDVPGARPGESLRTPTPGRSLPSPRPRFFGLLPPRGVPRDAELDSPIRIEPRADPAAEAALKRRVERAAREAVGDRARSIDVRVAGRQIAIRASGTRLLQRRAVRQSLESLPGISGFRTTVTVAD